MDCMQISELQIIDQEFRLNGTFTVVFSETKLLFFKSSCQWKRLLCEIDWDQQIKNSVLQDAEYSGPDPAKHLYAHASSRTK